MTTYNVVSPGAMVAGQPEDISVVLANFNAIAAVINGNLDNANIVSTAAIAISKLAGYPADSSKTLLGDGTWGTSGGVPTGALTAFGGAAAPTGWLLCDGASYLRTDFLALFNALGGGSSPFGLPDGTHFNVPDLRGRVGVGKGTHADVDALADSDGISTVANRRPKHKHTVNESPHSHTTPWLSNGAQAGGGSNAGGPGTGPSTGAASTGLTVGPQTGAEPTDGPAYLVVNYIIKT